MSTINYAEKIPNNVRLSDDRRLQRALEQWQPHFIDWWKELGPVGSHDFQVYLRTAIDVSAKGWAHFDTVKIPEYRWGIFLADKQEGRNVGEKHGLVAVMLGLGWQQNTVVCNEVVLRRIRNERFAGMDANLLFNVPKAAETRDGKPGTQPKTRR